MNAPILYIFIPAVTGITLFFLRKKSILVQSIGIGFSFLWGLLGFTLPIGEVITTGESALKIASSTAVLGRNLTILDSDRSVIGIIFIFSALWYVGAVLKKIGNHFIPIGLIISGLLIAAVAIEPFLYAALILAIIVLLSIVILTERGARIEAGILRYLVFQMLGVPFILLTGWVLTVAGVNPSDELVLFQAILFIILGFAFWLGIFPFHTWIPMLASEGNIIASGFIFSMLPSMTLLMLLDYINTYSWLRDSQLFFQALFVCGIIMLITGGVWAATQNNLKKLLGYAVIIETGFALIAIGLNTQAGYEYVVMALIPRLLAVLLASFAISQTNFNSSKEGQVAIEGLFFRKPWTASALLAGLFSLAGMPLLGNFPLRLQLVDQTFQLHPEAIISIAIGISGFLIGCSKISTQICRGPSASREKESRIFIFITISTIILLLCMGLFPNLLLSNLVNILTGFPFLK